MPQQDEYPGEAMDNVANDGNVNQRRLNNDDKNSAEGSNKTPILQQEGTNSGEEDIYDSNEETGGSQGSKRNIIKKRTSEPEKELPQQDEYPDEAMDNVAGDRHVNQKRLYNDDRDDDKIQK